MTKKAYQLLHDGSLVLSEIERAGMRIDVPYVKEQLWRLGRRIERMEEELLDFKEVSDWKLKYGDKFKLGSDKQLADVLFNELGVTPVLYTEHDNPSVKAEALDKIELPFIKHLRDIDRLKKMRNTYLQNILDETVDGMLRPTFSLNLPRTYRSSSSDPNFQNLPVRHEENKRLIRSAFLPRPGRRIGGIDYSGIEVCIAACYHKDPTMIEYISKDPSAMHTDMALQCYKLTRKELGPIGSGHPGKKVRYCAKNKFVFPQFYGDWWRSCARSLWDAIDSMGLTTADGTPLKEHLRSKGIEELGALDSRNRPSKGSFYAHLRDVEDHFWNERFKVYGQWKKDWVKQYYEQGYIDMLTGFRCTALMMRNDVINYPIQGAAFHCLLWSLIRLHEFLKKEKLRTLIIGQIHDEIVLDADPDELPYVLSVAEQIMCRDIREAWPWIIVPLAIEAEFAPTDRSWLEKEGVEIPKMTQKEVF